MFRSFRRSGPPPFQVMSNSWRGPSRTNGQPAQAPGTDAKSSRPDDATDLAAGSSVSASSVTAEPSAIQMPAGPLRAKERVQERAATAASQPPIATPSAPKANIAVKRDGTHSDSSSVIWAQRLTQAGKAIGKGAAVLGAISITAAGIIRERSLRLATRFGLRSKTSSHSRASALPRQTVVIGFAALAVVIMLVVWATGNPNPSQDSGNGQASLNVKDANLSALTSPLPLVPSNGASSAVPPARPGPAVVPPSATGPAAEAPKVDIQPKPRLTRAAVDPREKGQRYFILATYSVNKEEYLMPLLEFLWSQGVEAAAINGHNSGFFQIVALQGFAREEINNKAHKQYEETLRRIGRKYKAEGGGDDLQGLYLTEYSGSQAKLSITKAN